MQPTGTKCAPNPPRSGVRRFNLAKTALAIGLGLVLVWAFAPDLRLLITRWGTDAHYSHGVLVPLFSAVLLWLRRDRLTVAPLRPSWIGVPLVLLGAILHLAGAVLYVEWLDQVALIPAVAGVVLALGGGTAWRWAWPSIAFLVFMIPLPYRVETALSLPLQRMATLASTYALQTLGFPALAEGNVIVLDEVEIGVVEACNGLGMLVSFFAVATAVALLVDRPLLDRLVVIASAIPIAIIANVVRITVTGVLHETVGSRLANLVFHDLAGWLMMPLALGFVALELVYLDHLFPAVETPGRTPQAFDVIRRAPGSSRR